MRSLGLILTLLSLLQCWAQVPEIGKCPQVAVQPNFDPTRYFGGWYEITKFYSSFENEQKCITANYWPKTNGHFIVFNFGLDLEDHEKNATGDAYSPDLNEQAKIKVKFEGPAPIVDYWVLETDYDTYTLIYSCINVFDIRRLDFAWILSRKPTLDPAIKQRLFQKMDSYGIKSQNFKDTDQFNCDRSLYVKGVLKAIKDYAYYA